VSPTIPTLSGLLSCPIKEAEYEKQINISKAYFIYQSFLQTILIVESTNSDLIRETGITKCKLVNLKIIN
jgi:hypothetical protein